MDLNEKITIIVPVLNRPKNVNPLLSSYKENSPLRKTSIIFLVNSWCKEEIEELNKFNAQYIVVDDNIVSWAKKINYGINLATTNWVLCCADDVIFHPNWFDAFIETSQNFIGVIGTNDLGHPAVIAGTHTTHPIVHKKYVNNYGTLDEKGKFCHEGYHHNYTDVEFCELAKKRNMYKHSFNCKIEHIHPSWNKSQWDDVYQKGQDNWGHDQKLWAQRSKLLK